MFVCSVVLFIVASLVLVVTAKPLICVIPGSGLFEFPHLPAYLPVSGRKTKCCIHTQLFYFFTKLFPFAVFDSLFFYCVYLLWSSAWAVLIMQQLMSIQQSVKLN